MQAFQRDLSNFEKLDAQVLGVSADSMKTHMEFSEKYGLTFPLISDEKGELQKRYAPGRITYVIDEAGTVRFIRKGVPDTKELLEELEREVPR